MSPQRIEPAIERRDPRAQRVLRFVAFLLGLSTLQMFVGTALTAQGVDTTSAPSFTTSVTKQYFMKPTIVYRGSAPPVAGYLMDIGRDSLFLQTRGVTSGIAFSDIMRLTLPGRNVSGAVAMHGALIGAYVLDLLTWPQDHHPAAYASISSNESSGFLLSTVGYALAAGGVAYVIGMAGDSDESNYILTGNQPFHERELERLRNEVTDKPRSVHVHATVQLSHVNPNESDRAAHLLREGGRTPGQGYPYYYSPYYGRATTAFNLFRKGQLTITARPGLALGGAFMNLAEPVYQESANTKESAIDHSVSVRTKAQGYFVVGTYEPLQAKLKEPFAWLIGAGLGAASVGGEIRASSRITSYPSQTLLDETQSIEGSYFSAMLFSDFRLYIYSSLSLGLNAEYVLVNPIAVDAIGDVFPANMINLSSWSWGFVLGVHI